MLTSPAWVQTIVGPSARASAARRASGSHAPGGVESDLHDRGGPETEHPHARGRGDVRSSPASMRTGGAPAARRASTSHPRRRARAWRAAARQVTCAIWQPVVTPNERRGQAEQSSSQPPTMSSIIAAAGDTDVEAGVLVPRRGQPVGGNRRRERRRRSRSRSSAATGATSPASRRRRARRAPGPGSVGPSGSGPPSTVRKRIRVGLRGADAATSGTNRGLRCRRARRRRSAGRGIASS